MNRVRSISAIVAGLILIASFNSCVKEPCATTDTGSLLIKHFNLFIPSGITEFYLGENEIASIKTGNEKLIENLPIGTSTLIARSNLDTIYIDQVNIEQCAVTNYSSTTWDTAQIMSDRRLKQNINPITNALADINKLITYSYEYNASKAPNMNLPEGMHYGFMAQELKSVYPTFVKEANNGFYSVNYNELLPILTAGIQEQQLQIEALKKEVEELKAILEMP